MFTGIVTDIGVIHEVKDHDSSLRRIRIHAGEGARGALKQTRGQSVCASHVYPPHGAVWALHHRGDCLGA